MIKSEQEVRLMNFVRVVLTEGRVTVTFSGSPAIIIAAAAGVALVATATILAPDSGNEGSSEDGKLIDGKTC